MTDLSGIHLVEAPTEEIGIDAKTIQPVNYDTLIVECEKLELKSDRLVLKINNDRINSFKYIIINGRKYKLEEE